MGGIDGGVAAGDERKRRADVLADPQHPAADGLHRKSIDRTVGVRLVPPGRQLREGQFDLGALRGAVHRHGKGCQGRRKIAGRAAFDQLQGIVVAEAGVGVGSTAIEGFHRGAVEFHRDLPTGHAGRVDPQLPGHVRVAAGKNQVEAHQQVAERIGHFAGGVLSVPQPEVERNRLDIACHDEDIAVVHHRLRDRPGEQPVAIPQLARILTVA